LNVRACTGAPDNLNMSSNYLFIHQDLHFMITRSEPDYQITFMQMYEAHSKRYSNGSLSGRNLL